MAGAPGVDEKLGQSTVVCRSKEPFLEKNRHQSYCNSHATLPLSGEKANGMPRNTNDAIRCIYISLHHMQIGASSCTGRLSLSWRHHLLAPHQA
eukprot:scaffold377578_cov17-Prasinocladus_malaysianus.AAC.1